MKAIVRIGNYIKIDSQRALLSSKFVLGVLGVIVVLFWSSIEANMELEEGNVLYFLWWSTYNTKYLFVMLFCAIPYAGVFCEDLEHGYIKQQLIRGNLFAYSISKVLLIIITAIFTMVLGIGIFSLILSGLIPWVDRNDSVYLAAIRSGSFHNVIQNEHYFIYTLLFALQFGLLTSILAVLSSCVSLFISNKLLVWSIPMIAYYLISQYAWTFFGGANLANLNTIFSGRYRTFDDDLVSFLYAVAVMIFLNIFLTYIVHRRLKRRIKGE